MPAYGFKAHFETDLLNGKKLTTIRAERKDGWTPKEATPFYAYLGMRTKQARRIFTSRIVAVTSVRMSAVQGESEFDAGYALHVNGELVGMRKANAIARDDGFTDAHKMFAFFDRQYLLGFHATEFRGHLIRWRQPVIRGAIKASGGLLFDESGRINLPRADAVAHLYGFHCAERMVSHCAERMVSFLEGKE